MDRREVLFLIFGITGLGLWQSPVPCAASGADRRGRPGLAGREGGSCNQELYCGSRAAGTMQH